MCMYVCVYMCLYVCIYVCMYVRMYVCIYVCMYVRCMYVTATSSAATNLQSSTLLLYPLPQSLWEHTSMVITLELFVPVAMCTDQPILGICFLVNHWWESDVAAALLQMNINLVSCESFTNCFLYVMSVHCSILKLVLLCRPKYM